MDISKGLILKGTAATAAVATTSTGAYYHEEIGDILSSVFYGENAEEGESSPVSGERGDQATGEKTEKESLGLPDNWEWPTDSKKIVTKDLTISDLKTVNFDGKNGNEITSTSDVSLTIEKVDGSDNDFPEGFKFIFKTKDSKEEVTISGGSVSISLKKGMDLEFKIKKTGDKWSLERAWNKTTLGAKVNLTCPKESNSPSECSFNTSGTTNIFVTAGNKLTSATVTMGTGKIKLEEDQKGYNQGLKFTIEEADMTVSGTGSTGSGTLKLEKYETYEIKEMDDGGSKKWFFARKNSVVQRINKKIKSLGLPTSCEFEEADNKNPKECDISNKDEFKKISFSNKGSGDLDIEGEVTGMKLKMERNDSKDKFPLDLKFTFKGFTTETITIKDGNGGSNNIVLKKGTDPEFKLNSSGKLEKAWTVEKLGKKVGLNCTNPISGASSGECSFNGNLRIYEEANKKITNAAVSDTSKKLEFSVNEKDHNQGFKFTVKGDNDISLTSSSSGITSLTKNGATYEIKYQGDGWYLSKKTTSVTK